MKPKKETLFFDQFKKMKISISKMLKNYFHFFVDLLTDLETLPFKFIFQVQIDV